MYRTLAEAAANCTRNISTVGSSTISKRSSALTPERADPVHELLEEMKEGDCSKRVGAICALAELGPRAASAVPALVSSLDDIDWVVRVAAITALGELGASARESVPALVETLQKDDVCVSAAIALGRIGPEARAATEALTELRQRKTGFDCWCVEEALRLIRQR
ncbi:MAG TPA: HEAT repeat domain-containing protein [Planctomycetota bacterium]|jgi:HEAT repeat protein